MSNLALRVLVAAIGIPLVVGLIIVGGWWLVTFVALISTLGAGEFYRLSRINGTSPHRWIGIATAAAIPVAFATNITVVPWMITGACLAAMIAQLRNGPDRAIASIASTALGMIYPSLFLAWLVPIRQWTVGSPNDGAWLLLTIVSGIWMCDTCAYFVGRRYGNHPLAPNISPKKTWEGAIAGLLASIVWCTAVLPPLVGWASPWLGAVFGVIIGTIGQAGDLGKSLLKRDAHVKDSSALLPGHGGILDRFDSISATAPAVYGLLVLLRSASFIP